MYDRDLPTKILKIAKPELLGFDPKGLFIPIVDSFKDKPETAFFPGGRGFYYDKEEEFKSQREIKILVLGNDFGKQSDYNNFIEGKKRDADTGTWKNLIKIFNESYNVLDGNFPWDNCFFSNVYLGLRLKGVKKIGGSLGKIDKDYKDKSFKILSKKIEIIRPKLIITLGKIVKMEMDRLDKINSNIKIVNIIHPSMYNSNVKHEKYTTKDGGTITAEYALKMKIKDAILGIK
ncbi:hypothetical protein [Leptospira sp. GIMC2001]|uniref:hypothetical protein n=1 Tax=Leptospira sp. GIMC2001 TaxID=1513297 RepID=UPI00234BCC6A|nr:hypothetical protein [Leptospira sp. GIMC2001]WCL50735.1 hypothetical protein O4O04_07965 [Leptospira sp. GIMC2001]